MVFGASGRVLRAFVSSGLLGPLVGPLVGLLVVAGCKESAPPATKPPIAPTATARAPAPSQEPGTWYRARLVFDGVGDLPFFLHIPPVGQNGRAYVVNGDETADFQAEWRDNEITITGPWTYTSVIEAQLRPGSNALEGSWTRDTPLWGAVVRNFVATPIATVDPRTRFSAAGPQVTPITPINVAGTWRFQFAVHDEGKGAFEQGPDGVVRGYIKPGQLGDIRFLAGNFLSSGKDGGGKLGLSTFNGNAANLVLADVAPDGMSMSGTMSMQNVWNEKFTAKKVDDFRFVNKVHLKEGKQTVSLRGLDKYKGKPTLAIIFATWCSSCNDAYPFFKQLYATYHPQGLEMLAVAYDLSDDEKTNLAQLDSFRSKHQIPWELLQVPCTPETWAKAMPPELEGWDGLPIIMLIKPDGTVPVVFGGWFGPATGAEGERLRQWFEQSTKELVATAKG
jgi:thiol-disulfide isomerase/thioredoxin